MAEFPAFPLWTDAYLADTGELSTLEHGAYFLLLIAMWRAGGYLPNDDKKLAKCAHLPPRQWASVRVVLGAFLTVENDKITQGRLLDELKRARERSRKAADSARAKYRKNNDVSPALASSEQCSTPATISTTISISKEEPPIVPKGTARKKKMNGHDPRLYEEFERDVWGEFPRHPNSRKEPAFQRYADLPPALRAKCIGGVARYSQRFDDTVDPRRTREQRLDYVPHLTTWINQKGWETEYERQS